MEPAELMEVINGVCIIQAPL
ncbi:MAG: hypothetical protein RLZZ49_867, partial [Bacteroidota bacterium]